ncbi:hypothetical protein EV401DRAFT_549123 [Pisolithus croceorrhizus]|nr:hypothetical protein EV401DRAFT_549123 [Pisolithus croceorrhizus]
MPYLSSSHHSDGLSLKVEEELGEEYVVAGSPSWSPASSQITPSLVSSSDLSPRPTLSSTSSPSHTPPSAPPTPSVDSRRTVSPVAKGPSPATLRDMLLEQREQIKALWDGQAATLDEIRQRKEAPQDSAEIREHLHTIERRLEMLLDRKREVEKESTTDRRHEAIPGWTMRAEVESVSESSTDLESLHRRWSDLARAVRIHAPAARPSGPSLESLGAPLSPDKTGIQQSPPLIPSVYQPSRRPSRSTSTSSVIPGRSTSAPPFPDMGIFSPETLHHPPLRHTGQIHPSPQDPMLAHEPYPMGPPPMGPPVVLPTITIERAPPVMPVPGAPATGPIVIQLNPSMALPQSAIPSHPPSGTDLRSPHEHGMMEMPASPYRTHRSLHPEHFAQPPPEQPVIAPGSPSTYTHQEPRVVTLPTRTCPIVIHLAPPMALPQPVTPSQPPSGADSRSSHEHGMMEMPASAHHTHRSPHPEHFAQPPTKQPGRDPADADV